METVIREGALRHLLISDASCDVVLSCQGHRLMAHKLILSIASPVFRVSKNIQIEFYLTFLKIKRSYVLLI